MHNQQGVEPPENHTYLYVRDDEYRYLEGKKCKAYPLYATRFQIALYKRIEEGNVRPTLPGVDRLLIRRELQVIKRRGWVKNIGGHGIGSKWVATGIFKWENLKGRVD